ncbi:MAG TPA: DUF378 domain-containing protein [Ramlibacter sp.]|jgi:uncharacterized membrane protein YuzA (DUF378 family)|uniref:DUF378 domain-containing protein n=1 Tax=Ramlibacter sp. TaxID=1917967 RepID=UPI002D6595D6|nr:DUF378 domain-containing protein [Ramlibacter sp.]HZY16913.1 DUF378 domain-containing protein [Ramlibacter sp.]
MAEYDSRTGTTYRDPSTTSTTAGAPAYDDRAAPRHHASHGSKNILDWLAIILLIVGGLNWGLVGLFNLDLVATLFGQGSMVSRVIYIAVGLAAIWGFALMRLSPANRHA